ncbi:MAG: dephospho-CoA kinase [Alphaproteobacteria bacterium]|nr:MAG: dephospho-CoA kinase [Alphaproteobacteria bacterium]
MRVIGITGSIAMGKSTAAAMLARRGVPVHDADAVVHRLLAPGGAGAAAVAMRFPEVLVGNQIDRRKLGRRVFGDPNALSALEAILHPLVRLAERAFLARCRAQRVPLAVLNVPLLFERRGMQGLAAVIVVSAPAFLQRQRVLRRPGMTEAVFQQILAQQLPDSAKRRRADYVVPTGLGRAVTHRALARVLRKLRHA